MKVVSIRYGTPSSPRQSEIIISAADALTLTWGGLAQQYLKSVALHLPPVLLQLLTNLHPGSNLWQCTYKLRCGDGFCVIVKPTWNASVPHLDPNVREVVIEANISFRPTRDAMAADITFSPSSRVGEYFDPHTRKITVDLCVEKIDSTGEVLPFPICMGEVTVLAVTEHQRFPGVIDHYTLKKLEDDDEVGFDHPMMAVSQSAGKKRKERSPESSGGDKAAEKAAKKKKKDKVPSSSSSSSKKQRTAVVDGGEKGKAAAVASPTKSTSTKKPKSPKKADGSSEEGGTSTPKKAATPKKSVTSPKSSAKKVKNDPSLPKKPLNAYMLYSDEVRPQIMKENPGLAMGEVAKIIGGMYRELTEEQQQKYKTAYEEAKANFIAEYGKDAMKGSKKSPKKNKSNDEDSPAAANDAGSSPAAAVDIVESSDDIESEDVPKPPVTSYIMFCNDNRQRIKEENPDKEPKEIMTLLGAAWKEESSDDVKAEYKSRADAAMAEYKEKYGQDAVAKSRAQKKKKKKKRKKKAANDEGNDDNDDGGKVVKKSKTSSKKSTMELPTGWTISVVPRASGKGNDKYYLSPGGEHKFRSMPEVERFLNGESKKKTDNSRERSESIVNESEAAVDNGQRTLDSYPKKPRPETHRLLPKSTMEDKEKEEQVIPAKSPESKQLNSANESGGAVVNDEDLKSSATSMTQAYRPFDYGSDEEQPDAWNA